MEIKNIPVRIDGGYPDRVPTVTQWDAGQFLQILDSPLPPAVEFLFKNTQSDELLLVAGITEDGITRVQIPNELLNEPYDITAYAVGREGTSGKTLFRIDLDMQKRLPQGDIPTDPNDPYYINGLETLIESANDAVAAAENSVKAAQSAAANAQSHADIALGAVETSREALSEAQKALAVSDKILAAADKATAAAAAAQATADTLVPADTHYNPKSWVAQSGVAVSEAVWETLCNATDYTDEQLKSRVIVAQYAPNAETVGDFEGQLYFCTNERQVYIYRGHNDDNDSQEWLRVADADEVVLSESVAHTLDFDSTAPVSSRAFINFGAELVGYEDEIFPDNTTVAAALKFYSNEIIGMSFKFADMENAINNCQNYISSFEERLAALEKRVAALEAK